jgi:hypothetical protein
MNTTEDRNKPNPNFRNPKPGEVNTFEVYFTLPSQKSQYDIKQLRRAASLMKCNDFKISYVLSIMIDEKTIPFTETYVCLWVEFLERIKAMKDGKRDEFKEWPLAQAELTAILSHARSSNRSAVVGNRPRS